MSIEDDNPQAKDLSAGLRVTWVGMAGNLFLVFLKIWIGVYGKSQALVADGIHSLSDLLSDVIVLMGLKLGRKAEDESHPFGHGRIETVAAMLIGMLLLIVAAGLAYSSVLSIRDHRESTPGVSAILAAAVSILLKEALYWYTITTGRRIRSLALIGNAWHHRTDAMSSVAVLIGVACAYFNPSWQLADAYAALVVTFFIARVGAGLTWQGIKEVVDTAPDRTALEEMARIAGTVEGVRQVHDIRARLSGSQIFVEIHIVVAPDLTVRQGHDIARQVKARLLEDMQDVTRVIVHVDPELK